MFSIGRCCIAMLYWNLALTTVKCLSSHWFCTKNFLFWSNEPFLMTGPNLKRELLFEQKNFVYPINILLGHGTNLWQKFCSANMIIYCGHDWNLVCLWQKFCLAVVKFLFDYDMRPWVVKMYTCIKLQYFFFSLEPMNQQFDMVSCNNTATNPFHSSLN